MEVDECKHNHARIYVVPLSNCPSETGHPDSREFNEYDFDRDENPFVTPSFGWISTETPYSRNRDEHKPPKSRAKSPSSVAVVKSHHSGKATSVTSSVHSDRYMRVESKPTKRYNDIKEAKMTTTRLSEHPAGLTNSLATEVATSIPSQVSYEAFITNSYHEHESSSHATSESSQGGQHAGIIATSDKFYDVSRRVSPSRINAQFETKATTTPVTDRNFEEVANDPLHSNDGKDHLGVTLTDHWDENAHVEGTTRIETLEILHPIVETADIDVDYNYDQTRELQIVPTGTTHETSEPDIIEFTSTLSSGQTNGTTSTSGIVFPIDDSEMNNTSEDSSVLNIIYSERNNVTIREYVSSGLVNNSTILLNRITDEEVYELNRLVHDHDAWLLSKNESFLRILEVFDLDVAATDDNNNNNNKTSDSHDADITWLLHKINQTSINSAIRLHGSRNGPSSLRNNTIKETNQSHFLTMITYEFEKNKNEELVGDKENHLKMQNTSSWYLDQKFTAVVDGEFNREIHETETKYVSDMKAVSDDLVVEDYVNQNKSNENENPTEIIGLDQQHQIIHIHAATIAGPVQYDTPENKLISSNSAGSEFNENDNQSEAVLELDSQSEQVSTNESHSDVTIQNESQSQQTIKNESQSETRSEYDSQSEGITMNQSDEMRKNKNLSEETWKNDSESEGTSQIRQNTHLQDLILYDSDEIVSSSKDTESNGLDIYETRQRSDVIRNEITTNEPDSSDVTSVTSGIDIISPHFIIDFDEEFDYDITEEHKLLDDIRVSSSDTNITRKFESNLTGTQSEVQTYITFQNVSSEYEPANMSYYTTESYNNPGVEVYPIVSHAIGSAGENSSEDEVQSYPVRTKTSNPNGLVSDASEISTVPEEIENIYDEDYRNEKSSTQYVAATTTDVIETNVNIVASTPTITNLLSNGMELEMSTIDVDSIAQSQVRELSDLDSRNGNLYNISVAPVDISEATAEKLSEDINEIFTNVESQSAENENFELDKKIHKNVLEVPSSTEVISDYVTSKLRGETGLETTSTEVDLDDLNRSIVQATTELLYRSPNYSVNEAQTDASVGMSTQSTTTDIDQPLQANSLDMLQELIENTDIMSEIVGIKEVVSKLTEEDSKVSSEIEHVKELLSVTKNRELFETVIDDHQLDSEKMGNMESLFTGTSARIEFSEVTENMKSILTTDSTEQLPRSMIEKWEVVSQDEKGSLQVTTNMKVLSEVSESKDQSLSTAVTESNSLMQNVHEHDSSKLLTNPQNSVKSIIDPVFDNITMLGHTTRKEYHQKLLASENINISIPDEIDGLTSVSSPDID